MPKLMPKNRKPDRSWYWLAYLLLAYAIFCLTFSVYFRTVGIITVFGLIFVPFTLWALRRQGWRP